MRFRRLIISVVAGALATAVAACSSGTPAASSSVDSSTTASSSTAVTAAFPVTIDHVHGQTVIESEPTRVLTLGLSDQDAVLALGVTPIAVSQWYGDYASATWPWAAPKLGDAKPVVLNGGVRNEEEPRLEEIVTLDPDVIISLYNGTTKEQYDQLSRIAPVVLPTEEFADYAISWQEGLRITGVALGKSDLASTLTEELDARFTAAAKENPQFAGVQTVIAERFEPGASVVRASTDPRGRFFEQLGLKVPADLNAGANEYGEVEISDEQMDQLDRDLLVWNIGSDPALRSEIEALPLYAGLEVVKQDDVLFIDDPVISGAFTWSTVLSLDYALTELLPQLQQKLPA